LSAQIRKSINQFNKNLCCLFIFEVFGSGSFLGALLFFGKSQANKCAQKKLLAWQMFGSQQRKQ